MSNELSKAIKRKTDAQFRTMGEDRSPSVSEGADGSVLVVDPSAYTIPYVAGKNIFIGTSGSNKVINAIMNLAPGANISVSEPDPTTGQVTISATIGGKEIDLTGLADGHVLAYDQTNDKFIFTELPDGVVQATETTLGGVKAKARTTENSEVVIDGATGMLYAPESYTLPQASELELGGIKAKEKTSESSEVAIDPVTGKLYSNAPDEAVNGLPAGGADGQVLAKTDATDYNAEWIDPPKGGIPVVTSLPESPADGESVLIQRGDFVYLYSYFSGIWYRRMMTNENSYLADELSTLFSGTGTKTLFDYTHPLYNRAVRVTCPHATTISQQWTFTCVTGGNIEIFWEMEGEQTGGWYDYAIIYVDNVELTRQKNPAKEQYHTRLISAGTHTIRIDFNRDGDGDGGYNGFQLFEIRIPS